MTHHHTGVPNNLNSEAAWSYPNATRHSYASIRTHQHFLDFANQPIPFKIYPTLEPSRLPGEVRQTGVAALSAISTIIPEQTNAAPDLNAIAQLLYLSAGIAGHSSYPGGEIYFRAAACTGALYEVELYLVCGDLAGLPAGVYHFAPAEFALRQLRAGDYRSVLIKATGGESAITHAPLTIVCTCTYWRNAWKYQARTYRHFGWDNGTLVANLLAVAGALGLPAKVVGGFVDENVNNLLDVDSQREVAFSLVPLGYSSAIASLPVPRIQGAVSPLGVETVPLSRHEIDYPLMREMHAASSFYSPEEVAEWREDGGLSRLPAGLPSVSEIPSVGIPPNNAPPYPALVLPLQSLVDEEMPRDPIEQVILRRGSSRQFARTPITLAQ